MKVARHCPRCRAHRYHFVNIKTRRVHCAECGHEWRTRWKEDEREDIDAATAEEKRREAL
jgi:uncharacterized Zn finger protein (UPF0148 family)